MVFCICKKVRDSHHHAKFNFKQKFDIIKWFCFFFYNNFYTYILKSWCLCWFQKWTEWEQEIPISCRFGVAARTFCFLLDELYLYFNFIQETEKNVRFLKILKETEKSIQYLIKLFNFYISFLFFSFKIFSHRDQITIAPLNYLFSFYRSSRL